jgi:hypothetical protein
VAAAGDEIKEISRERWDDMPVGQVFEVVIDGRLRPVVRCKQCRKKSLVASALVTKEVPFPHVCTCGCGGTVQATRTVEVLRYR